VPQPFTVPLEGALRQTGGRHLQAQGNALASMHLDRELHPLLGLH
jgi:hypothetical protein